MNTEMRVVLASGGTGGHVYPCLVVAESIRGFKPAARFLFIGARGKIDEDIISQHGFEFASIDVTGFPRGLSARKLWQTAKTAAKLATLAPVLGAMRHIQRFRPNVVFGAGGYVTGPVVLAAWARRVPSAILEANAVPGLANRLAARFTDRIFIGFEPAARYFGRPKKTVYSGNPVRVSNTAEGTDLRRRLGFDDSRLLVAVVGGSLGSRFLNDAIVRILPRIAANADLASRVQVIHCVGDRFWQEEAERLSQLASGLSFKYSPVAYAADIYKLFYATDLVVCRAGACTLSEIALSGAAPILIPWAGAANDEQSKNAEFFSKHGAAVVLTEQVFSEDKLFESLSRLVLDDPLREEMRTHVKMLSHEDAAEQVALNLVDIARS